MNIPTEPHYKTRATADCRECGWNQTADDVEGIALNARHHTFTTAHTIDMTVRASGVYKYIQFTADTCPGRPCGAYCDHVGRV